jgi:hypothetical protein
MFRRSPAHAASTVSLHVRSLEQLFNSLDPSPFWDRHLDREAATFIEEEFSDRPRDRAWLLNVSIAEQLDDTQSDLQEAVKRYYLRLTDSVRHQVREQLRVARISLALGIGVFLACMVGRELLDGEVAGRLPRALDGGLIVLAWIALWLPIEQLVSDLVPLLRQRSFYGHLARIRVHLRRTPAVLPTPREAASPGPIAPDGA